MLVETERATKRREALRIAQTIFEKTSDWVTLFRQTLGVSGAVRQLFPLKDDMADFEQSEEFGEIQQMVSELRKKRVKKKDKNSHKEPTKVITVRMPKSLHEVLCAQAVRAGTSINHLCISKLLQLIEAEQTTT